MAVSLNGQRQTMTYEDYQVMTKEKKLAKLESDLFKERQSNHPNLVKIAEKEREIVLLKGELIEARAERDKAHESARRAQEAASQLLINNQQLARRVRESNAETEAALFRAKVTEGALGGGLFASAGVIIVNTLITPVTVPVAVGSIVTGAFAGAIINSRE